MTGNWTDYLKSFTLFTTVDTKHVTLQGKLNNVSKDGSALTFLKKRVFGPSEDFKGHLARYHIIWYL